MVLFIKLTAKANVVIVADSMLKVYFPFINANCHFKLKILL